MTLRTKCWWSETAEHQQKVLLFFNQQSWKGLRLGAASIHCRCRELICPRRRGRRGEEEEPTVGASPSSHPDVIISSDPAVHLSQSLLQLFPSFCSTAKPTDSSLSLPTPRFSLPPLTLAPSSSLLPSPAVTIVFHLPSSAHNRVPFLSPAEPLCLPAFDAPRGRTAADWHGRDRGARFLQPADISTTRSSAKGPRWSSNSWID